MSSLIIRFDDSAYSLQARTRDVVTKNGSNRPAVLTARVLDKMRPGSELYRATLHAGRDLLEEQVVVKWARTTSGTVDLEREAAHYEGRLCPLQGVAVPRCYGLFLAEVAGDTVAALVLQMCNGGNLRLPQDHDLYPEVMLACSRVHMAGVNHGQLHTQRASSAEHLMVHRVGQRRTVMLVDFSLASAHACEGATPVVTRDVLRVQAAAADRGGCRELNMAEMAYGLFCDEAVMKAMKVRSTPRGATTQEMVDVMLSTVKI